MLPRVDIPDQPVFAYFFDVFLCDDGGAPTIFHIVITAYVVNSFFGSSQLVVMPRSLSLASISGWAGMAAVCLFKFFRPSP